MATAEQHHIMDTPTFDAPVKLAIVVSPYYKDIADNLPAIRIAHRQSNFDGFVALGCIIRGETTHYDTVCNDSSHGLMLLGLQGCNIGNGILTVETRAQAEVRADPSDQNKGPGGRPDEDDGSFQIA